MIQHDPIFDTSKVIAHYSEKDSVPINYVCTTELYEVEGYPVDIFYRETPHPEFGNRYFGLYRSMSPHVMITNADSVEDLAIDCISDDGYLYYSRYRHDFVKTPNGMFIDGGRAYTRSSGGDIFTYRVKDGMVV